ncbi:MAG: tetratricopeptide repeat protein [Chitinophagales bacterium]|nr:tetratricopeptide repeat protein [Chitinophagales bacterium]
MENLTEPQLEELLANSLDTKSRVDVLCELAWHLIHKDSERVLKMAAEAYSLAEEINYGKGKAIACKYLGSSYSHRGELETSIKYYTDSVLWHEQQGNKDESALLYGNIGSAYWTLGNYTSALGFHEKALSIYRELGNQMGVGRTYQRMGDVLRTMSDFKLALEYLQKSIAILQQFNDPMKLAQSYSSTADLYAQMGEPKQSIAYYEKALDLYRQIKLDKGVTLVESSMASAYLNLNDYEKALELYQRSYDLFKKFEMEQGVVATSLGIGQCQLRLGFLEQAAEQLQQTLAAAEASGLTHYVFEAHLYLSEAQEQLGNYGEALKHHKAFHEGEKEVRSRDAIKNVAVLEAKNRLAEEEAVRKTTEKILHNILPKAIAEKIKDGEEKIIQRFESASVLFADMVGFTRWSESKNIDEVAETLNRLFNMFDELANTFGVEKIKTIGDAYMCVSGLPEPCHDHAVRIANMALAMNKKVSEAYPDGAIKLRIGIHCGEVIAGVLGKNKYAYDLWGDTVNTASRMESHGVENKIQVSEEFKNLIADKFEFEEHGTIEVKGKGKMSVWFLVR